MVEKLLAGKRILVTGGTGSFGHQIANKLLDYDIKELIVFSRDEMKQYYMRKELEGEKRVSFIIGDVRNFESCFDAMRKVDLVFHAAALKHVPHCEENPFEAVRTNIIGAENVARAAIQQGVDKVVAISTDKAVEPINVMGMTKAVQERIILGSNSDKHDTKFTCVRYGNVVSSRGSVVPFFKTLIAKNKPLPITDVRMTRFLLTLEQAVTLVLKSAKDGKGGEIFVMKVPACKIVDLAKAIGEEYAGKKDYPVVEVGLRPGEKLFEVLVSGEEIFRVVESDDYYTIHPFGTIKTPVLKNKIDKYTSQNTTMLSIPEIRGLLAKSEGYSELI